MAIAAWSAKVLTTSMCFCVKACTVILRRRIAPSALSPRSSGTASVVRWPCSLRICMPSGNSAGSAAARSSTCTGLRSTTARPVTQPRKIGLVSPTGVFGRPPKPV